MVTSQPSERNLGTGCVLSQCFLIKSRWGLDWRWWSWNMFVAACLV